MPAGWLGVLVCQPFDKRYNADNEKAGRMNRVSVLNFPWTRKEIDAIKKY